MPRAKFQTLTEQMFYILLCLKNECCGTDIMEKIKSITEGRIILGPGTLYNLLEQFVAEKIIIETKTEGRRRSYILTEKGRQLLENEYNRILKEGKPIGLCVPSSRFDVAPDAPALSTYWMDDHEELIATGRDWLHES